MWQWVNNPFSSPSSESVLSKEHDAGRLNHSIHCVTTIQGYQKISLTSPWSYHDKHVTAERIFRAAPDSQGQGPLSTLRNLLFNCLYTFITSALQCFFVLIFLNFIILRLIDVFEAISVYVIILSDFTWLSFQGFQCCFLVRQGNVTTTEGYLRFYFTGNFSRWFCGIEKRLLAFIVPFCILIIPVYESFVPFFWVTKESWLNFSQLFCVGYIFTFWLNFYKRAYGILSSP